MPVTDPLFWQGLTFSTATVLIVVAGTWWLFWSPLPRRARPPVAGRPSPRLAGWLAVLLGFAAIQMVTGGLWDGSMHILTGEIPAGADFLWPPHLMIYSSFLVSLLVAVGAVGIVAVPAWRAGERDPRLWVRRNPYLGAVALASLYSLLSIPGDALWHALYGIDLTAWSPPHVLIAAMMCAVMLSAVAMLVRARDSVPAAPKPAAARPATPPWNRFDLAIPVLLGLTLAVALIIGTVEWELWGGGQSHLVRNNPIWVYPMVAGVMAFAAVALARALSRFPWAATLTALTLFGLRLAIAAGLGATGNVVPSLPPLFLLGALLVDALPWQRLRTPWVREAGIALAFTAGYALLALPQLAARANLPRFAPLDFVLAIVTTLALSLLLAPLMRLAGARLIGQPARAAAAAAEPAGLPVRK